MLSVQEQNSRELIEVITSFINLLLAGKAPDFIRSVIFGGTLTALEKNDGGLRPIVVGFTLRRIVAKMCCRRVCDQAAELFSPR